MDRIKNVLENYSPDDVEALNDTINMLLKNGVANGCYQDYSILIDVIKILDLVVQIVRFN